MEIAKPIELNLHAQLQTGTSFLTLPREQWPLRHRATISQGRESATTAAVEPSAEGAQLASKGTLSTNNQDTTEQKGHLGPDQLRAA